MWPFKKKVEVKPELIPDNIEGVTMNWAGKPCLSFKGGYVLRNHDIERERFPEYYRHGEWPTDPETGEKLPIAH